MNFQTFCLKRPNARLEALRTAFNKLCEGVNPFKADPDAENWEVVPLIGRGSRPVSGTRTSRSVSHVPRFPHLSP